ncbi:MAG: penicillin-binding protein, partial [Candidatus Beckwithbacteria bacterium GW2011_GWA2_47_25]
FGVWVEELSGSKGSWGLDETNQFTAASVIKLPILVAYYEAVDEGRLDPETLYTLVEADRLEYGTGSLQHQPAGTRYSYREIAELTANQSDNMGAELLIKFLGGYAAVQRTVNSWGLSETDLRENLTTPQEMGDLLTRLYRGELISEESRDELFANLTNTLVEDRIPAGVPTGVKVVHKYGSEAGVVNDCGIVYADTPYVICVLSQKVNAGEAEAVLPKISRVVWEWRAAAP